MLLLPLAFATLVLAADEPKPAAGSVPGPWLFAELEGTVVLPVLLRNPFAIPAVSITGGYGGSLDGVRLIATLRTEVAVRYDVVQGGMGVDPVLLGIAMALPDVANDRAHTRLRFSPVFGVEAAIPGLPSPARVWSPVVTPWLGGQLERRFGPLELSYRAEARGLICGCGSAFQVAQRLLSEVWMLPSLSAAAGLDFWTTWGKPPEVAQSFYPPIRSTVPTNLARVRAMIIWNFSAVAGLRVEGNLLHSFAWNGLTYSSNTLSVTAGFTFRTDELLQRNWIDR